MLALLFVAYKITQSVQEGMTYLQGFLSTLQEFSNHGNSIYRGYGISVYHYPGISIYHWYGISIYHFQAYIAISDTNTHSPIPKH